MMPQSIVGEDALADVIALAACHSPPLCAPPSHQRLRTARSLTGKKVIAGEDPDEVEKWEVEMLKKEQAAAAAREASFEEAHRRTKEKTEAAQAEAGF